jgi:quercetin dioxygenase-like cupin family protein
MRNTLDRRLLAPPAPGADTVSVLALLGGVQGCARFEQRLLLAAAGESRPRTSAEGDELLYVLEGEATLLIEGQRFALVTGSGVFLPRGAAWALACAGTAELLSVLVREPVASGGDWALVDLAAEGRRGATAARQFSLGVGPEVGCHSATQFIGFVPPGRAPAHFHRYDEVIYILTGQGVLHLGEQRAPLAPGVCVHLPAGLVHCLENSGGEELQLLGVFSPAGSPAEAYYPDGTPATYPEER